MDLIPILSTIVLVMTIATCILAVAAYFLYKARERKARKQRDNGTAPALVQAEEPHMLVAPQTDRYQPALGQGSRYDDRRRLAAPQGYGYDDRQHADYDEPRQGRAGYEAPQTYRYEPLDEAPSSAPAGYDYDDRSDRQPPPRQPGSMFYEYTGEGSFVPLDPQDEYGARPRQALPAAPPPVDSNEVDAARHYASRQQAEATDAEARAYHERAEADQARSRAAELEAQRMRDNERRHESGFEWL
jgi:hypothetical protein